jgi:hypothetical protein
MAKPPLSLPTAPCMRSNLKFDARFTAVYQSLVNDLCPALPEKY